MLYVYCTHITDYKRLDLFSRDIMHKKQTRFQLLVLICIRNFLTYESTSLYGLNVKKIKCVLCAK